MEYSPSPRKFRELSRSGRRVPVAACLPLDSDARSLFETAALAPPHILLESARLHPVTGRWSMIVGEPAGWLTAVGRRITLSENGRGRSFDGDPFEALEKILRSKRALRLPGFPPFVGGAVGVIGFEAARLFERLPARAKDDLHLPDLAFLFCNEAIVLDHLERKLWVIALRRSYDEAVKTIDRFVERLGYRPPTEPGGTAGRSSPHRGDSLNVGLARPVFSTPNLRGNGTPWPLGLRCLLVPPGLRRPSQAGPCELESTHTRAEFGAMVCRAKQYIAAGDIYQANLSQRFSVPLRERPWDLYRRLTEINPSPFAAYADFGSFQIVSASPERLLRVRGDRAETRPIAGTRPRGQTAVETARLRRELLLNEKERAEHLMLVDLERNDLGRVCRYGSVETDDLMGLEEYSHVIHIVSNVRGRLRAGAGLTDLVKAVFPGGTISGCPKIRCLEIIDELEPVRRHYYTGSLGYLSDSGDLDLNLLIRTAVVWEGQVHVQAGAGIVADSNPAREYDETVHKAQALLEAIAVRPELVEV